ncbi:hypothetical protein ALC57_02591 [Trachymyrmex cornetzi]|uniref:Uncharacterized protein n=1 Tax=Trachymyrmex cornetzi TaxID=471704 RepID=A0A151JND2_9HYME|nr:hypothetical protein ALC57_02591 [Trachymyrmex cornetzi]
MIELRNKFFRQVFSLNVQHFEFETCIVIVRFRRIFNHDHANIHTYKIIELKNNFYTALRRKICYFLPIITAFESRDGKSILFVMSPGPQPTSIHVPDILFKSLANSFIAIDTPRFCISLKEACSAGFIFNCLYYYTLRYY